MTHVILCCISVFVLLTAMTPTRSAERAGTAGVLPHVSSPATSADNDCDARIQKLEDSQAEGEERLAEKYAVINYCAGQYKYDKAIKRLVQECAPYAEQPVLKQQFLADCQLAAFGYANALYSLRAEFGK
jgi:hypothetical protein